MILSGGEVLIDPVREEVLYPALEALRAKYAANGGVKLTVQTTGDLLTEKIIGELLARDVRMISVAGMDDFHAGMQGEKREPLKRQLISWFEAAGMAASGHKAGERKWYDEEGPLYSFFGATPDSWIGKLWPRGRAWTNGLSAGGCSRIISATAGRKALISSITSANAGSGGLQGSSRQAMSTLAGLKTSKRPLATSPRSR